MTPFLAGIAAAFLARIPQVKEWVSGPMASACVAVFLVLGVGFFQSVDDPISFLLVSLAFIGIACGNDLFGFLTHPLSRTLGQISYSIYLLHGIILFVTFTWVIGYNQAATLSPLAHWAVIVLCSIAVVGICSLTYRFIEKPALESATGTTEKLRRKYRLFNPSFGDA
jgi:peptidoglycan/LPS O-acetylase OafA/YrhL